MTKYTERWLKRKHHAMWDWLAENPNKEKEDWVGWDASTKGEIFCNCFMCQFASQLREDGRICEVCPSDLKCDDIPDSLYEQWLTLGLLYRNLTKRGEDPEKIKDVLTKRSLICQRISQSWK